ncbi:MAG: hypothetical protein KF862_15315 [Chitinophagaceae bacterium]|nr:hypothetical protein [Chitinophagaceae bacterium]
MAKQFQTKKQQVAMFIVLLALVIAIAVNVKAGTYIAGQDEILIQQEEEISLEGRSLTSELKDFPWSPVISFFTVR